MLQYLQFKAIRQTEPLPRLLSVVPLPYHPGIAVVPTLLHDLLRSLQLSYHLALILHSVPMIARMSQTAY